MKYRYIRKIFSRGA